MTRERPSPVRTPACPVPEFAGQVTCVSDQIEPDSGMWANFRVTTYDSVLALFAG